MQTVDRPSSLRRVFPITTSLPTLLSPRTLLLTASIALTACGIGSGTKTTAADATAADATAADATATSGDAASTTNDSGAGDATVDDGTSGDAAMADAGTPDAGTADTKPAPTAKYVARTPTQVKALLAKQPRPLLINVHIPFGGEIVGTDKYAPYNNIAGLRAALGDDKSTFAVLYCMTGPMSYSAVNALVKLGYWNLIDMPGGMVKWKSLGYPFSKSKASK